jgi:hypothetical protein
MNWLNGKKSVIALILWMVTAAFCKLTGQEVGEFEAPESWTDYATMTLESLAALLGVVGLAHKAWKKYVVAGK